MDLSCGPFPRCDQRNGDRTTSKISLMENDMIGNECKCFDSLEKYMCPSCVRYFVNLPGEPMKVTNTIIDIQGSQWMIIEAESLRSAINEIAFARVIGSNASESTEREVSNRDFKVIFERVIAKVKRLD